MASASEASAAPPKRNPHAAGRYATFAVLVAVLLLYVLSTPQSVGFWDVGEMQTVPYILGIAHPTAFPVYVLTGWLFSHVLVVGTVAWRMNIFSGVCVTAACAALIVTLREMGYSRRVALPAALLFALGETVWTRGTRADVHTLALCFEAFSFAMLVCWNRRGIEKFFYLGAIFFGCSIATHPVALWSIPALTVLAIRKPPGLNVRLVVKALLLSGVPLLTYLYLPIRSAQLFALRVDPTLRLGLPPGRPFWDYAHPDSVRAIWWILSGAQFERGNALFSFLDVSRYPDFLNGFSAAVHANTGLYVVLPLVAAGIFFAFARRTSDGLGLLLAVVAVVPFALSYTIEADKDRYLLFSFWAITVCVAIAVSQLSNAAHISKPWRPAVTASVLFSLALTSLWMHRGTLAQRYDASGDAYVSRILAATPANAIIVAPWVLATPLGYAAYVERRTENRIIVVQDVKPGDEASLEQWMKRQPVYMIVEKVPRLTGICYRERSGSSPLLLRASDCRR